jgi:hypothetical protein
MMIVSALARVIGHCETLVTGTSFVQSDLHIQPPVQLQQPSPQKFAGLALPAALRMRAGLSLLWESDVIPARWQSQSDVIPARWHCSNLSLEG